MSRYRGPRLRLLKRLGSLPGFGSKLNQKFLEQKKDLRNENLSQTSAKKKKKNHLIEYVCGKNKNFDIIMV